VSEDIAHKQPKRFYAIMYSIFALAELKSKPQEIELVILNFFHDVVRLVKPPETYQAIYNSSVTISMVQIAEELAHKTQKLNLRQAFKTRSIVQSQCYCGAPGSIFCPTCSMKQYCSIECQTMDASAHQIVCTPPRVSSTTTTTTSTSTTGNINRNGDEGEEDEVEEVVEEGGELGGEDDGEEEVSNGRRAKRQRTSHSYSTTS